MAGLTSQERKELEKEYVSPPKVRSTERRPKGDTGIAEIYTADKGQPPMEPDMGSAKPVKKAKGGTASSRADGCCVKGKTRGKMV